MTTSTDARPVGGGSERTGPGTPARARWRKLRLRRPSFPALMLWVPLLFMLALYAAPIVRVLSKSFTDPHVGIENFRAALTDPLLRRVFWTTVRLSLEVTLCTAVFGVPVAYFMSRLTARAARIVSLFVIIPFWTSVLVRSFAWIVLLGDNGMVAKILGPLLGQQGGILYTEPAVIIAMTHVLLPFMILTVKGSLDQIDPALMRAARTLGAGPVHAFLRVYAPLAIPSVVSGCLLVFIMSLGYYITPALVGGPKQTMISMMIEQQVNTTFQWGLAASLSVLLLLATIVLYAVVQRFAKVSGLAGQA